MLRLRSGDCERVRVMHVDVIDTSISLRSPPPETQAACRAAHRSRNCSISSPRSPATSILSYCDGGPALFVREAVEPFKPRTEVSVDMGLVLSLLEAVFGSLFCSHSYADMSMQVCKQAAGGPQ